MVIASYINMWGRGTLRLTLVRLTDLHEPLCVCVSLTCDPVSPEDHRALHKQRVKMEDDQLEPDFSSALRRRMPRQR